MTRTRTLVWLVAGIVSLAAVHFAVDVRTATVPHGLRRNVLVPSSDEAAVLSVERPGEPAVRLVKDGSWKIVSPYAAIAEQGVVLRLTDALAFAPISDEMTDAELLRIGRTREDFGLLAPRAVVTVGKSAGDAVRVAFGAATPSGDGVYAVVGDRTSVYVVPSNVFAFADMGVSGFRHRRLCSFRSENVSSFDVRCGAGWFVRIARDGESWKMSEPRECAASSSRVRQFLNALSELESRDFVWPVGVSNETGVASASLLAGYGLDAETAFSVMLKCADGKDSAISFGRGAGKDRVYALVQGGTAIATVPLATCESVRSGADAFVDARLFSVDEDSVSAVSIVDEGAAYLLSRNAGGVWRLDSPVSALADPDAVKEVVRRILTLKSSAMAADGVRVSVGTNAEPVSVSRQAVFAGTRPEDLRSKVIVTLDPKLVKRVVVTEKDKALLSAVFDSEGKSWGLEGSESVAAIDGKALTSLVASLDSLKAIRVARLKVAADELGVYGLDKPVRTVAVDQTVEGSVRRNVLIGNVTDGGRYATLGASDAVFVISSESAAALLAPIVK